MCKNSSNTYKKKKMKQCVATLEPCYYNTDTNWTKDVSSLEIKNCIFGNVVSLLEGVLYSKVLIRDSIDLYYKNKEKMGHSQPLYDL